MDAPLKALLATVQGKAVAGLQPIQWSARIDRRLAEPGTYLVRWADADDVDPRTFVLRPDPATASPATPTSPTVGSTR